jgi:structure-specific recognition protein 1
MQGPLYILISRLFKPIAGIQKILIPGDFRSAKDGKSEAIQCDVRVSNGYLYPMKNSLIFIQKPILYIKHKEIKYVEFSRCFSSTVEQSKSFDISIVRINGEGNEQFKNIDKLELKVLTDYFKKAGIKMRKIDPDTNKAVDLNDLDSDDLKEEIQQSQSQTVDKDE